MKYRWYDLPEKELLELLHTDKEKGLTKKEAALRLKTDGKNVVNPVQKAPIRGYLLGVLTDLSAILMLALAALALILRTCVFGLVEVAGQSMENTLETGDVALVSRLDYRLGSIRRGDVAQIRVPGRDGTYLKRVVGLPGEKVELSGGRVFIDGRALEEPYARNSQEEFSIQLGEDEYFVLGDNRGISKDSRYPDVGQIDKREVLGKAIFLMYPGTDDGTYPREFDRVGAIQ